MKHLALAPRAQKDLEKVSASSLRRIERALEGLSSDDPNLDVKPLSGLKPWRRLRVGSYRVLFRPLTRSEMKTLAGRPGSGYLIARVVDRKEQDRAIRKLG